MVARTRLICTCHAAITGVHNAACKMAISREPSTSPSDEYARGWSDALKAFAGATRKRLSPESVKSLVAALITESPSAGEAQGVNAVPTLPDAENTRTRTFGAFQSVGAVSTVNEE